MSDPRDIVERLRHEDALNLRCVQMQIDEREPIYAEAADELVRFLNYTAAQDREITSLRQRAEDAERRATDAEAQMRRQSDHHDEEEQAFDETVAKSARRANEAEQRIAELEAALEPKSTMVGQIAMTLDAPIGPQLFTATDHEGGLLEAGETWRWRRAWTPPLASTMVEQIVMVLRKRWGSPVGSDLDESAREIAALFAAPGEPAP